MKIKNLFIAIFSLAMTTFYGCGSSAWTATFLYKEAAEEPVRRLSEHY